MSKRDAAVAEAEKRAGEALGALTGVEPLSLREAVQCCGETVTVREATRLRGDWADRSQDDDEARCDDRHVLRPRPK